MPQLEPFCSAKLLPLQPQDVPTKEDIFQKILFLVTCEISWLQKAEGGGAKLWKGMISLYPYLYSRREWVWFGDCPPTSIRNKALAPPFGKIYGATRSLQDWDQRHHPLHEWGPSMCTSCQLLQSLYSSLINLSSWEAVTSELTAPAHKPFHPISPFHKSAASWAVFNCLGLQQNVLWPTPQGWHLKS